MSDRIQNLTQKVRDLINRPEKQYRLLKDEVLWHQLCSALDVIEDTHLAIESYSSAQPASDGESYLRLCGLLQCLYLQQDAINHLCEALGMQQRRGDFPELKRIRDIRNTSIGHPTKRWGGESFHRVNRPSISHDGYDLISYRADGRDQFERISTDQLVRTQRDCVGKLLEHVARQLEREWESHKERFKMEKLTDIFDGLNYCFGKLLEFTGRAKEGKTSAASATALPPLLAEIRQKAEDFKRTAESRDIPTAEWDYVYQPLDYGLQALDAYLSAIGRGDPPPIDHTAAYIFASFVRMKMDELFDWAKEIDAEYA